MPSVPPHPVAAQSDKLRTSNLSESLVTQHPVGMNVPTSIGVHYRGRPLKGATSRTLNRSESLAEALPVRPCATSSIIPTYTSMMQDNGERSSFGQPGHTDLSLQQSQGRVRQGRLTPSGRNILSVTTIETAATSAMTSEVFEVALKNQRPRTVEEALKIFDGVEEHAQGGSETPSSTEHQVNWIDTVRQDGAMKDEGDPANWLRTLKPDGAVKDESCFHEKADTGKAATRCSTQPPSILHSFVLNADIKSVRTGTAAGQKRAEHQQESGSEEEGATERPLDLRLVSRLTDDEPCPDVQILIARSMKLTTVDPKQGACDWKKFSVLSVLSLSHNSLTDISPLTVLAPTLKDINVSFNNISDLVPLFSCTRLKHLRAAYNHVSSIVGIGNCKDLETLILFHNCLHGQLSRSVEHIQCLTKLKELDIDENPLLAADKFRACEDASLMPDDVCAGDKSTPIRSVGSHYLTAVKRSLLQQLLMHCPSLQICGGVDVQSFSLSAPGKPDVQLMDSTKREITVSVDLSHPKTQGPPAVAHESERRNPAFSVAHASSSGAAQGLRCASEGDSLPATADCSQTAAEGPHDVEPAAGEGCSSKTDNGTEEVESASNVDILKMHIRSLQRDNRNMYTSLEENEQVRRRIQQNTGGLFAASASASTIPTQSAQLPFGMAGTQEMSTDNCSSDRQCTEAPFTTKATTRELPVSFGAARSSQEGALTDHLSNVTDRSNCRTNSGFRSPVGVPEKCKPSSWAAQNEDQHAKAVTPDKCLEEKSAACGCRVQSDTDGQTTEALKWENEMLKQRLHRMVKYIQLLREDLDHARFSGVQQIDTAAKIYHSDTVFAPCGSETTKKPEPPGAHSTVEGEPLLHGRTSSGEREGSVRCRSSESSPPSSTYSRRPEAPDTSPQALDDSCSSSISEAMEEPQSPVANAIPTDGISTEIAPVTALTKACPRRYNSTPPFSHSIPHGLNMDEESAGGSLPCASETNKVVQHPGWQMALQREKKDLANSVERTAGISKDVKREVGDTEGILSRPTSASSFATQRTAPPSAPLRVTSKSSGKKGGHIATCGTASTGMTQPLLRHQTTQQNLRSRAVIAGHLPSSALTKDPESKDGASKAERPSIKQTLHIPRRARRPQQPPHDSVTNASAPSGAARLRNSGSTISSKTYASKLLGSAAPKKETPVQSSLYVAVGRTKPVLTSAATDNSTFTVSRSKCTRLGSLGAGGSDSSRQAPAKCILPPLHKTTDQVKHPTSATYS